MYKSKYTIGNTIKAMLDMLTEAYQLHVLFLKQRKFCLLSVISTSYAI